MNWKVVAVKLLFSILIFAIVTGLLPMSNVLSMHGMDMDTAMTFHVDASHPGKQGSAESNLDGSCCDGMYSSSMMVCDFLNPQLGFLTIYGESKQFSNSNPIVQLVYLESTAPPPKA